jgi:hypothetical protein
MTTATQLKPKGRSAVTNGRTLLPGIDGRGAWARRLRDVLSAHLSDMGGADNVSEAERSLLRRAAILTVELETMEFSFAKSDGTDAEMLDLYQRTASSLRRILESVGLGRRMKDVTTLGELLREGRHLG